jgi:AraC-like DNA-binding protein
MEQNFCLKKASESDFVRYTLPPAIGNGYFELFHPEENCQIWITHAQSSLEIDLTYTQDENTYIGLAYIETEAVRKRDKGASSPELQDWRSTRSLPSDGKVYGLCRANEPIHAVNVLLFQNFFFNYLRDQNMEAYFDLLNNIQNFDEQTFMRELYPVLAEILHCPFQGNAKSLFMKSRIYDIAARLIALCDKEREESGVSLSHLDIRQIRSIPAILEDNLVDPPSIAALSRRVTLNEFKLKAGFKKIFNTTIYEYLRQLRTERAIELMKEELTLEQIAERVGYKSTRGFSQAFVKCTGVTPSEWRKQHNKSMVP